MDTIKTIEKMVEAFGDYTSAFGQALEAHGIEFGEQQMESDRKARQAIQAGRALIEALAKQEQGEPVGVVTLVDGKKVGIIYDYSVNIDDDLYTTPQAKQEKCEPVAWLYPEGLEALQAGKCWTAYPTKHDSCTIPLSLCTPQQRTWVGLTDVESLHIFDTHVGSPNKKYPLQQSDWLNFSQAIEAKLKEKNGIAPQGSDK